MFLIVPDNFPCSEVSFVCNEHTLVIFCLVLVWYFFLHSITLIHLLSLYLKCIFCMQGIVGLVFISTLLISVFLPGLFRPSFKVIINMVGFNNSMLVTVFIHCILFSFWY